MNDDHFGEHLMIDGYGGDPERLNNEELVGRTLQDLPNRLDMKILGGPHVYHCEGNGMKDPGGWTGVVIINESHISVHTFAAKGFVSIDVYTCQNGIDTDDIIAYFVESFSLKNTEVNFVKRGLKYAQQSVIKQ